MKKLLTLVLCWIIAFSAMAETTLKAKTALSAAGGYITSQNKVDGSFEDGISSWVASVGTIVKTSSTEMQGNNIGVWSGTGAGTLDLQWTATASNTFEGTAQVNTGGEDDVYICAYVGTTETGCKLLPVKDGIQKVSVIADSIISSAFYLRLKHTGSDAFSVKVDDAKIEPWNLQNVQTVEQESIRYVGANLITTTGILRFNDAGFNKLPSNLFSYNSATGYFTAKRNIVFSGGASLGITSNAQAFFLRRVSGSVAFAMSNTTPPASVYMASMPFSVELSAGESVYFDTSATMTNSAADRVTITATAISDNVVQSYSNDRVGETIYSIQNVAPQGFISAQGSILGKTSGSHQGEAYKALYDYSWAIASATAGEPYLISSAKGASAQADWDAGKTITIDESGLFTRAYKKGTSGVVGAKQLDAFQGHWHSITYGPSNNIAGAGGGLYKVPYSDNLNTTVTSPVTDGTNDTPRTASETRPVNVAKYVFIRYAQSVPTLLALPTRSEVFSSIISASGVVSNATQNFVTSCTNATPSVCSLWSSFGVAPICWSHTLDITKRAEVTATTATTATVARTDTGTAFNLFCHLK